MDTRMTMQTGTMVLIFALMAIIASGILAVAAHQRAADHYVDGEEMMEGFPSSAEVKAWNEEMDGIYDAIALAGLLLMTGIALGFLGSVLVILSAAMMSGTEDSASIMKGITGTLMMFVVIGTVLTIAGQGMIYGAAVDDVDGFDGEELAARERTFGQGSIMTALGLTLLLFTMLSLGFTLDRWMDHNDGEWPRSPYP